MKNLFLATIVIVGIALIGQPSTASANLLTNPGFEGTGSGSLDGWFPVGDNVKYAANWAKHSGGYGAVINAAGTGTGMLLQEVSAIQNDTVTFTGWSSGNYDLAGSGQLMLEFWSDTAQLTGGKTVTHSGPYGYTQDTLSDIAPLGTTKAKVIYAASGTAGCVMFDDADATVTPIPEPTSMLLLGTGLVGLFGFGRKRIK